LPRVEATRSELAEERQTTELVQLPRGNETILLVEDEAVVRELARSALADSGYTVLEARSPHDALQKLHEYNRAIHLLLTDVVMPGMSGRELATHLMRHRPELKVLYMSGYPQGGNHHQEVLEASTPLLQKPFTPQSLLHKVRSVLSR
jgi:two-component system cell cycle sensor histidine kinase/response regulator CckA